MWSLLSSRFNVSLAPGMGGLDSKLSSCFWTVALGWSLEKSLWEGCIGIVFRHRMRRPSLSRCGVPRQY